MSKFWREISNAKFLRGDNKYVEVCTKQIYQKSDYQSHTACQWPTPKKWRISVRLRSVIVHRNWSWHSSRVANNVWPWQTPFGCAVPPERFMPNALTSELRGAAFRHMGYSENLAIALGRPLDVSARRTLRRHELLTADPKVIDRWSVLSFPLWCYWFHWPCWPDASGCRYGQFSAAKVLIGCTCRRQSQATRRSSH